MKIHSLARMRKNGFLTRSWIVEKTIALKEAGMMKLTLLKTEAGTMKMLS